MTARRYGFYDPGAARASALRKIAARLTEAIDELEDAPIKTHMARACPKCRERSLVIDSRDTATTTRRRRMCASCGNRWTTIEVVLGEPAGKVMAGATAKCRTRSPAGTASG